MAAQRASRDYSWPDVADVTRKVMRGNRGKNTRPEVALRRHLHHLGYRFRVHGSHLPGTPDIVFSARRAVIQGSVHGRGVIFGGKGGGKRADPGVGLGWSPRQAV